MNTTAIIHRQIFVSGKVQGVFFRESTRLKANELKLGGGVRNLRDGRVEVWVAGDEPSVYRLIKWLEKGPKLAKVSTIEVVTPGISQPMHEIMPSRQASGFEIWATR